MHKLPRRLLRWHRVRIPQRLIETTFVGSDRACAFVSFPIGSEDLVSANAAAESLGKPEAPRGMSVTPFTASVFSNPGSVGNTISTDDNFALIGRNHSHDWIRASLVRRIQRNVKPRGDGIRNFNGGTCLCRGLNSSSAGLLRGD